MLEALSKIESVHREWVRFYLNDWIEKAGSLANVKRIFENEKQKQEARFK